MLHVISEHAFEDCAFLADEFSLAMLPALEPASFIGLPAVVSMLADSRELAFCKFAFVDFCAAEDILSAAMLLIRLPVSMVKATIIVAHSTMTLLHVVFKDALILISIARSFFTLAVSEIIAEMAFVLITVGIFLYAMSIL